MGGAFQASVHGCSRENTKPVMLTEESNRGAKARARASD